MFYNWICLSVKEKRHRAGETGWRNGGREAFGWIFTNSALTVLLFRDPRSGKVVHGVFGDNPLNVNVISDRYKRI